MTGAAICAQTGVRIGDRVTIGANCTITDTDFHPLDAGIRSRDPRAGATESVTIGDDAFIGMHVLILKGSRIGSGAVIGAGSVVAGEVPPRTVVGGNPARIIRALDSAQSAPTGS
jgi:acetyltransferase-like isoleucine patch superfamily enzyme